MMGKVIHGITYVQSEEDDSSSSFMDTYFVTANESGRLKKMWTWLTVIFFLIGTSVSLFSFFWR
jgi:hypothetical protein